MTCTLLKPAVHAFIGMANLLVGMMCTHMLGSVQWLTVQDNDHTQQQAAEHATA